MKKRVLSALMAVGLACSLVVTAFATADVSTTPAPTAAVESQNTETESSDPAAEADPTETPAETPAATQEPTPAPEESTPAPSEEPASSATPEPTAEPSAAPDDTVTATPTPTPEATTAPTPEATEEPAAAEPTAEPEATAEPAADNSADGIEYTAALEQDGQALNVIVTAPADAFGEDVSLVVAAIENTDETDAIAAELDESGVTYDGFAALDISFKNAAGEEVEPSAPVTVRIELPDSIVDSGIDLNTLAVQHLAEDADGNVTKVEQVASVADGSIALSEEAQAAMEAQAAENTADDAATTDEAVGVAPMMLAANNAQTDATAEAAAVAEFEVSGFSWFTITYNDNSSITVHLVDVEGNELAIDTDAFDDLDNVYDPRDFANKYIVDQWVNVEELANTWAYVTEGYTFQGAYRVWMMHSWGEYTPDWDGKTQFYWIRYNASAGYRNNGWRYLTNNTQNPAGNGSSWTSGNQSYHIYLVYEPITEEEQSGKLQITDHVTTDGTFTATYSDATDGSYYVWQRRADDGTWTDITRLKMNGNQYNLSDNGEIFHVVLDVVGDDNDEGGGWYRVSVYESEQAYESHEPALETSKAYQLQYYDQLQNGNFETPNVDEISTGNKSNYQYPVGTTGLVWKTTGNDQQIEIVNATNDLLDGASDYNNRDGAAEGVQYAELNCQAAGALYQDVLTVPGTTLNWQFSHRGRGGQDTMYLVIAPADEVESITTQEELNNLIRQIQWRPQEYAEQGYYLFSATDNNDNWRTYRSDRNTEGASSYEVPNDQYLTRFFFVAGEVAAKHEDGTTDYTVGNLLDDVAFTTGLLPAEEGEANLQITKVVEGVTDLPDDYTVTVNISGEDYEGQESITISNFSQQSNGTYTATAVIPNIPVAANTDGIELTVTESTPGIIQGYSGPTTTVQVGSQQPTNGISAKITLEEQDTGEVTFTNTYEQTTGILTISKKVSGLDDGVVANEKYEFVITAADPGAGLTGVTWEDGSSDGITVEGNKITVSITGVRKGTLTGLPLGTYTVNETTPRDLDDYYYVSNDLTATNNQIEVGATGAEIEVTNTYEPYKAVTLRKEIAGGMSVESDTFEFTIDGIVASQVDNGGVESIGISTNDDGNVVVTMKGDQQVVIEKLKQDAVVTITETNTKGYTPSIDLSLVDGYTTSDESGATVVTHPGFEVTGTIVVEVDVDQVTEKGNDNSLGTIKYINTRDVVPPTGLESDHTTPYGLMVGAAGVAGAALVGSVVVRRRRRRQE